MAEGDVIKMDQRDRKRLCVIHKVLEKELKQFKAADFLGLSTRQIKRIVKRVREEGDRGLAHKSRGKPSNKAIPKKVKAKVIKLYEKEYGDFGPTFATEKLDEINGISISHETLRLWLLGEGKHDWQRKARPHRQWRQRKEQFGEMVQMDGSHHDWLEGRGPWLVFMGYVDDATSKAFGRFYDYEGTMPAMDSFHRYIKKYGLPQSIYLDKLSTYKSIKEPTIEEQLNNEEPMSQFERAMKELEVKVIHANSAQAKGRVERKFGVFQDRLVKEMRLAGIKTKDEANKFLESYLPKHNKRFSVPPLKKEDLHRKDIPSERELKKILCAKTRRSLRKDSVIRHNNRFYLLKDLPRRRIKSVFVEDRLDGSMWVRNNGSYLKYKEITPVLITRPPVRKKPRKVCIPPADHPWRKFTFGHSHRFKK